MKVVIDTNVVVSALFFGGRPRRVMEAVLDGLVGMVATPEMLQEYLELFERMAAKGKEPLDGVDLGTILSGTEVIDPVSRVSICRDSDDDKFIGCAIDAGASFIVTGDRDILDLDSYEGIEMIAAAEFCDRFLG